MYPVLFRIGSFEITSFGVLVAVAALVWIWLLVSELARREQPSDAIHNPPSPSAAIPARSIFCAGLPSLEMTVLKLKF